MNRGFPLTEFVLEATLRDGLGDLKANPSKLDDLFARFTEAQFANQFGQTQIDRLKTYIANNQIKISHAYALQPSVIACFSIQILGSEEREEDQHLGNIYEVVKDPKIPDVIVNNVTPLSYDGTTGKLQVDPSTDLSTVCPGLVYKDNSDNEFNILSGISNLSGNKYINIGKDQTPDLAGNGQIISSIDFTATNRRMIRLRELIRIGAHAKDDLHLAKYLYYILFYILKSRQDSLITRGIHLDNSSVSLFDKDDSFEGENVFSRYVDFACLTEFNWDQDQVAAADCFDLNLYVNDPTPSDPDKIKI